MLFGKDSKLAHLLLAVLLRCTTLAPCRPDINPLFRDQSPLGLFLSHRASSAQNTAFSVLSENVMQHLSA